MSRRVVILLLVLLGVSALGWWILSRIERIEQDVATTKNRTALDSLAYISSVQDDDPREGVIRHDPQRSQPGFNLVTSWSRKTTELQDLEGETMHTWSTGAAGYAIPWQNRIYVVREDKGFTALDHSSSRIWNLDFRAHHEVSILGNGDILTFDRVVREIEYLGQKLPILDDRIVKLSADGTILWRLSLWDVFGPRISLSARRKLAERVEELNSQELEYYSRQPDSVFDILHANAVTPIEDDIPGVARRGDLLVSIREPGIVAILRLEGDPPTSAEVIWTFHGQLDKQHHPTALENGHILIYDNGRERKYTRVIEVDPQSQEIVWEYNGTPPQTLYSPYRGSAQRLPNGNTLIAESDRGRVVEVTPDKRIVWEYLMHKKGPDKREPVYRMLRITDTSAIPDELLSNPAPS